MEVLHTAPDRAQYTPLSAHQSQTPASFYDGPAILHHHLTSCTLKTGSHDLNLAPAFKGLAEGAQKSSNGQINGHSDNDEVEEAEADEELEISGVDVWITTERFILFSSSLKTGIAIPYPSISLHAVQRPSPPSPSTPPSLFLQLLPSAPTFDDHDPDATISLTITPSASAAPTNGEAAASSTSSDRSEPVDEISQIYTALSACANLHPDPPMDGDEDEDDEMGGQQPAIMFEGDAAGRQLEGVYPLPGNDGAGGLPPPMPGSGGWITAENVGEFFDEEGDWRGRGGESGGALGEGAGRIRTRDEDGGEDEGGDDGEEGVGETTKWRRTS